MEIKFCKHNFNHGTDDLVSKLVDNYPQHKVVVEDCLDYCDHCDSGPFAMVNNKIINAQSSDELYEIIKECM